MLREKEIGNGVKKNALVRAVEEYKESHKYNIPVILRKLTCDIASCIGGLRSIVKVDTTKLQEHIDMNLKVSCTVQQLHTLQELFKQIDFTKSKAPKIIKENALGIVSVILAEIDQFFLETGISSDTESDHSQSLGESSIDSTNNI